MAGLKATIFVHAPVWLFALGIAWLGDVAAEAQAPTEPAKTQAAAAFEKIATVLMHPRCRNCHQAVTPLQTDLGRVHIPKVARGQDNLGVGAMRCSNCHREENNASSNVPGAPLWQMAPPSMQWSGLSVAEVCGALKDRTRNGNRDLDALVEHVNHDKLVLWGWAPGGDRARVPMEHKEFVDLVRIWVAGGGECPPSRR